MTDQVHLSRGAVRDQAIEALASRYGGRVGLRGVLDDLNRTARPVQVPAPACSWGCTWDEADATSRRWWPQGITTSADHSPKEAFDDRAVVLVSAYAKDSRGRNAGSRISVFDVTDRARARYRHVLLVEPRVEESGQVRVRPVHVHAGGLVWSGDNLIVAGTGRGLLVFRLADLMRVPPASHRMGLLRRRGRPLPTLGYRYVLPLRLTFDGRAGAAAEPFRYSFLGLDRSVEPPELITGEYGVAQMTTRLLSYHLDHTTGLPSVDATGDATPVSLAAGGPPHMQGVVRVGARTYVTASNGRRGRGSIWAGSPDRLAVYDGALPPGPEDLSYWPSKDELWSVTEYPGRRYVYALRRSAFD